MEQAQNPEPASPLPQQAQPQDLQQQQQQPQPQLQPPQAQPPLAGPPPPRTTTTPTEYTPTLLVKAYDVTLGWISAELGNHMYQVFQEMRTDAETYGKQHKEKPKRILAQLLDEVKDWRHIPVEKGDSSTILDQEVEAVRKAVPNMMNAVEDALRTGAIFLSGARGASAEGVTIKVPPIRDFVNEVYVRVAKEYSGRNGISRLYRHLTMNKDKLIGEVRHAASAVLFPRESVWGLQEDLEKTVTVPPPNETQLSRKTIPLGNAPPGQAQQQQAANPDGPPEEEFTNEEMDEGGSESGSEEEPEDGF